MYSQKKSSLMTEMLKSLSALSLLNFRMKTVHSGPKFTESVPFENAIFH